MISQLGVKLAARDWLSQARALFLVDLKARTKTGLVRQNPHLHSVALIQQTQCVFSFGFHEEVPHFPVCLRRLSSARPGSFVFN